MQLELHQQVFQWFPGEGMGLGGATKKDHKGNKKTGDINLFIILLLSYIHTHTCMPVYFYIHSTRTYICQNLNCALYVCVAHFIPIIPQ